MINLLNIIADMLSTSIRAGMARKSSFAAQRNQNARLPASIQYHDDVHLQRDAPAIILLYDVQHFLMTICSYLGKTRGLSLQASRRNTKQQPYRKRHIA